MTVTEHNNKLFNIICAFGKLGNKLNKNLKAGIWCNDQEDNLLELKYLINILSNYDTRDLPAMTNNYNCITGDQYLQLICQIESKLWSLTFFKMIGQIEEALGINSDDSVFDYRLYQDLINQQRVVDVRNEYNRVRTIPDSIAQSIPCFELEIVDATTCCGEVLTGCQILRSKEKLPITVDFHQTDGILFIKPNKITSKPTIYVSIDRIPYVTSDPLTANFIYSFLYNGYLYLYSKNSKYLLIDSVTVYGIFADPFEAGKVGCNAEDCFDYNSRYPLSDWMWQTLTKPQVLANLVTKQYIKLDETNDARDDKTEQILNPSKI